MKILFLFLAMVCSMPSFAAKWKAKHVVLIGLDGWGAYSVEKRKFLPFMIL